LSIRTCPPVGSRYGLADDQVEQLRETMGEFEVDRHSVVHPGVVEEVDRSGLSVDPSRLVSTTSRSVTFPATAQGMFRW
jgi:hypothetical protein